MWLITNFGFFSIVEKPDDRARGKLTIRARVRSDLECLRDRYLPSMGAISESSGSDYRFRAIADRQSVATAMQQAIADIDYANFKNAVAVEQGWQRADKYHDVWAVLYGLQDQRQSNHGW